MVALDPPVSWDHLSGPAEWNSSTADSATLYWSETPPFSLSSTGLSTEVVHVSADFQRPLLVFVFAPSGAGFSIADKETDRDNHKYKIEVCLPVEAAH